MQIVMQCSVKTKSGLDYACDTATPGVLRTSINTSRVRHETASCSAGWLLRTTMSSTRFPWFPQLVPSIFKVKEKKSKVSNEH